MNITRTDLEVVYVNLQGVRKTLWVDFDFTVKDHFTWSGQVFTFAQEIQNILE